MSNEDMPYNEYLRRYFPSKWREVQKERQRKPFESDEELDRRLMIDGMVKNAMRIIRKGIR